jgi:hypothetical protein
MEGKVLWMKLDAHDLLLSTTVRRAPHQPNQRSLLGPKEHPSTYFQKTGEKAASPREMRTEIIRPQDDREHSSPKTQVQEPNRKEPGRVPRSERQRVLLDLYFDFLAPRSFRACF